MASHNAHTEGYGGRKRPMSYPHHQFSPAAQSASQVGARICNSAVDPGIFDPSRKRAQILDRRMRTRLAESVTHIVNLGFPHLTVPEQPWESCLQRLAEGPVSPSMFGAYYDLVFAINEDDLDSAQRYLTEFMSMPSHATELRILDMANPIHAAPWERYCRLIDTDPTMPALLAPPSVDAAKTARGNVQSALSLMEVGCSSLASEIRTLLREIVLVSVSNTPEGRDFDGASSFMLWGAVILNAKSHRSVLDMVQALSHESGHNVLFGLCADGTLVEGKNEIALFPSPLRADLRPMDGIVHATYVIARMHFALRCLMQARVLDVAQSEEAEAALDKHVRHFDEGIRTIERYGHLTEIGLAVIAAASRYMATGRRH